MSRKKHKVLINYRQFVNLIRKSRHYSEDADDDQADPAGEFQGE